MTHYYEGTGRAKILGMFLNHTCRTFGYQIVPKCLGTGPGHRARAPLGVPWLWVAHSLFPESDFQHPSPQPPTPYPHPHPTPPPIFGSVVQFYLEDKCPLLGLSTPPSAGPRVGISGCILLQIYYIHKNLNLI